MLFSIIQVVEFKMILLLHFPAQASASSLEYMKWAFPLSKREKKNNTKITKAIAVKCVGRNTSFPKVENTINGFSLVLNMCHCD